MTSLWLGSMTASVPPSEDRVARAAYDVVAGGAGTKDGHPLTGLVRMAVLACALAVSACGIGSGSDQADPTVDQQTMQVAADQVRSQVDEVVPGLGADGRERISRPSEAPGYRLRRDDFTLGWTFASSGEDVAVVGGSTPCFPIE